MADEFQVNGTSPPSSGAPYGPDTRVILPESTGRDGNGNAVGAVGRMAYLAHMPVMSTDALAYYLTILGEAASVELTSLELWNPYEDGWVTYTNAVMHRPTIGGQIWRGSAYRDVRILFTEIS